MCEHLDDARLTANALLMGADQDWENKDWENIGEGYYATVYGKEGNPYVVKNGCCPKTRAYYQAILDGKLSGHHYPRLYGIWDSPHNVESTHRQYSVVLERLIRTLDIDDTNRRYAVVSKLSNFGFPYCSNGRKRKDLVRYVRKFPREFRSFARAGFKALRYGRSDIGNGNVMARTNGTLVLTDPVAE